MKNRCARHIKDDKQYEINIDTLIERFKKMRALNCTNPYDLGLDGYMWKRYMLATRSNLAAKMF